MEARPQGLYLFGSALLLPLWFAIHALITHVLLRFGMPLPTWLLPLDFIAAAGLALLLGRKVLRQSRDADSHSPIRGPALSARWLLLLGIACLLGLLALTHGAISTVDRTWDGFIAWSLRAKQFSPPAPLETPYHTDLAVFAISRDYPLLQAIFLGAFQNAFGERLGRIFFPLLYLGTSLFVYASLLARALHTRTCVLFAMAFALTPMWFSTGAGAVDSGYATLLICHALAVVAAGLLLEQPLLLSIGIFLLPMTKPEGIPYALLALLVTLLTSSKRLHTVASLALASSLLLWLPLRASLSEPSSATGMLHAGIAGAFVLSVSLKFFLHRFAATTRGRLAILLGLLAIGIVLATVFASRMHESRDLILSAFLSNVRRLPDRISQLPDWALGCLQGLSFVRRYGMIFLLALALWLLPKRLVGEPPSRPLSMLLGLGLASACASVLLSPEEDIWHEFDSRFDRVLLQWVGVAWLFAAPWISQIWDRRGTEAPSQSTR